MKHFLVCEAESTAFSPSSGGSAKRVKTHKDKDYMNKWTVSPHKPEQKENQTAPPEIHFLDRVSQQTARLWKAALHLYFTVKSFFT